MKKLLCLLALSGLILPMSVYAVKFEYKDERGQYHYTCQEKGTGGIARVTKRADDQYLVFGASRKGVISAGSVVEAARIACGEDR